MGNCLLARSLFILSVCLSSVACADSDPAASPCAECHGADGIAVKSGIPHLNGQLLGYMENAMAQFQGSRRPGRAFGHDSAGMDGGKVFEMLKHYSTVKAVRPKQEALDPALVEKGGAVYQKRCAECHPDNGRDSDNEAPLMAAQDMAYLVKQGRHFLDGKRKYAPMMDKSFQGLSDADLEAVAHFFASQEQLSLKSRKRRR